MTFQTTTKGQKVWYLLSEKKRPSYLLLNRLLSLNKKTIISEEKCFIRIEALEQSKIILSVQFSLINKVQLYESHLIPNYKVHLLQLFVGKLPNLFIDKKNIQTLNGDSIIDV